MNDLNYNARFNNQEMIEDPETLVKIVTAKQQKYDEIIAESTKPSIKEYKPVKKEKPYDYKRIIITVSLLVAFGAGSYITTYVKNTNEDNKALRSSSEILSQIVQDNTYYGDYNLDLKENFWWYDIDKMADDILQSKSQYDIDSKIYGCYINLKEYNKMEHMDSLMRNLKAKVSNNANAYNPDIVAACQFDTFLDYVAAKGLTLDEYQRKMNDILIQYGKSSIATQNADDMLYDLNNPNTLDGGSR